MLRFLALVALLVPSVSYGQDFSPFTQSATASAGTGMDFSPFGTPAKGEGGTGGTEKNVGPDRVVMLTAKWCPHCKINNPKVEKALKALEAKGWSHGKTRKAQFQYLDVDDDKAEADAVLAALGITPEDELGLPWYVKIEGGEIVRRFATGCETPLDQWSLAALYTGTDERPNKQEKDEATVKRNGHYPLTGSWWSVEGDWRPSRSKIINHLLSGSIHARKFDRAWLNSLSLAELQSVHTDDHRGALRWAYVNTFGRAKTSSLYATKPAETPREKILPPGEVSIIFDDEPELVAKSEPKPEPAKQAPVATYQPVRYVARSSCPTGNCPYQRRSFSFWK